jgi:hypothetical protein
MSSNKKASKSPTQSLNKEEREAKEFIKLGFLPHEGEWKGVAKKLLDGYHGKYWSTTENKHRYKVNSLAAIANLLLPNFIFDAPYVQCNPISSKYFKKLIDGAYQQIDNARASNIREAALNHKFRQIDAVTEQRKAVFDSLFWGFGITKVGYSYETITEDDKDYTLKDSPFLKRIKPQDIGWHPMATGLDDSPFIIHRSLTNKARLKGQKRFKDLDKVVGEVPQYIKDRFPKGEQISALKDWVTLYEVHNQDTGKIYTYAGETHILIDKMDNPYTKFKGSHFSQIRFMTDNDEFSGIPLLGLVYDECVALNEVMTLIVEHFRKFPGQVFMNKGAADADDITKIQNGEQGSVHLVNDISQLLLKPPLSGGEYYGLVNLFQNIMDRTLGIPDFQRLSSTTRKSATEASFVQGDATVRRQYAMKLVKDFMLDGIRKIAAIQEQFTSEKEYVQASGDLRGMSFEYDNSDLVYYTRPGPDADESSFRFDFDIDSLKVFNAEQIQNLSQALQIVSQIPELKPGLAALDPVKGIKMVFKGLGINYESLQAGSAESSVFVSPEIENDMARNPERYKNQPMPAPKAGEDHKHHFDVHSNDLKTKGPNDQLLEHAAETMMLMQKEGGVQPPPPGLMPPGPEGMQGPTGPMQAPPITIQ